MREKPLLPQPWPLMEEARSRQKRLAFIGWPALIVLLVTAFLPEWWLTDGVMIASFTVFAWSCLRVRYYDGVTATLRNHRTAIRLHELNLLRDEAA